MKEMLVAIAVLAMTGCTPKSHRLLGEGEDGGTAETGASSMAWTSCADAAAMARHMDACSGWEGSECGANATLRRADVATCIVGRVLKAEIEANGWGDPSVCTDPISAETYLLQVVSAAGGCADFWVCEGSSAGRRSVCQRDPLPAVRPEAAGLTPWTQCETALQNGMDGDPCEGELLCAASRRLSDGTGSNVLLVFCDGGILRMVPMMSAINSVE